MTEQELRQMERMWADGTSLKVMAHRMGYAMEHLGFVMREFALKAAGRECMTMRSDLVDEYAGKLRLREDA